MSKKLKIVRSILKTRAEVEAIVNETVAAQLEREARVVARDAELLTVGNQHNPAIDLLAETMETNCSLLEQWLDAHPDELGDARSLLINEHRLGFRTGNPKVETTGKLTFKAILASLVKLGGDLAKKFVRTKPELDKEAILATARLLESSDPAVADAARVELETIGVEIVQTEAFFFEPNRAGQAQATLSTKAA